MKIVLAFVLLIGVISVQGDSCIEYFKEDGICSNYISKTDFVYLEKNNTIETVEDSLRNILIAQGLSILYDEKTKICVDDFTRHVCATTYPKCTKVGDTQQVESIIEPCKSTCTDAETSCNNIEQPGQVVQNILSSPMFPKNCSGLIKPTPPLNIEYPVSDCNLLSKIKNEPRCFSPLVVDTAKVKNESDTLNANYCYSGCCLPCPQSCNIYPEGYYKRVVLSTQIVRTISAIASGFILISYLILPKRRSHPNALILFAALSIFLYSSNVIFSIFNQKKVQCADDINPSTQGNNKLCAVQGAFLIFAAQASTIWAGIIIFNLHLHTVWNSNILANKYIYIHIIAWGVPAFLTIMALATASIKYQFGGLCSVAINVASELYFYPMLIVVVPSFLIHLYTSFHIFKQSRTSLSDSSLLYEQQQQQQQQQRNHVIESLRIQWRAFVLVISLTMIVLFYWLVYFFSIKKMEETPKNEEFMVKWLTCIQSDRGQDECSKISRNYTPSLPLLVAAEVTTSLIGFILFGLFANNVLWDDWSTFIRERLNRSQIRKVEVPDQFFII